MRAANLSGLMPLAADLHLVEVMGGITASEDRNDEFGDCAA